MLIRVALPVPLYREFDYLPPSDTSNNPDPNSTDLNTIDPNTTALPPIGGRVQVSFGRQTLIGIVVDHVDSSLSEIPVNKLKAIKQVIDNKPLLSQQMLSLARWLAGYYHYPLGDVLSVMLPTLIRQGKPLDLLITHWRILPNVSEADFHSNAHKQRQQFAMLKLHGEHGASEDTLLLEGMQRPFLKLLEESDFERVAAFSHGAFTKHLLDVVIGKTLDKNLFYLNNGGVCIFEYKDNVWRLKSWNI